MYMLASRQCASLARSLGSKRTMAISATVKKATDTSAMEFAAPSNVGLTAMVGEIAQDVSKFYSDPTSSIEVPDAVKIQLKDEIEKKTKIIIGDAGNHVDPASKNVVIPDHVSPSDNPLFETYKDSRASK